MKERMDEQDIQAFEGYLRREEREESTRKAYLRNVRAFAEWLDGRPIDKEMAVAWKEQLRERYAPATVNVMLAAVNAFFAFLGRVDCRVKALRVQRRVFREQRRELTRREYELLVAAAEKTGKPRLALLMETICSTGIRVSEVKYITLEAVRKGCAEITLKGKVRTILLPGKLCRKLKKYAENQKIASGEIFLTRGGKSMGRRQIWAEMKSICGAAGVDPGKVFPHNLRHLFATLFYHVCRDIVKLADVLGHSSIETTRIYLLTTGAEHSKTLEKLRLVT